MIGDVRDTGPRRRAGLTVLASAQCSLFTSTVAGLRAVLDGEGIEVTLTDKLGAGGMGNSDLTEFAVPGRTYVVTIVAVD